MLAGALAWALGAAEPLGLDATDLLTGAALLGVLAPLAVLRPRAAGVAALALAATWLAGYALYRWLPAGLGAGVPVDDAVGGAAFFEFPYQHRQLAGGVLVVLVLAGAAIVARRGAPAAGAPPAGSRRSAWLTALGAGVALLTLFPDLDALLVAPSRAPFGVTWDVQSLVTWDWLQQQGLKPMVDFWYPYGNFALLQDFPSGPLWRFAWQGVLLAVAAWSLYRLAGPRPLRIALCLLAVVLISLLEPASVFVPPNFWRYLPALLIPVAYAAAGPLRSRRLTPAHAVLFGLCALTGAMEADILLYGVGGMVFVAAGELLFEPPLRRWSSAVAAFVDALPVLAALAAVALVWAATGTFTENVDWFGSARAVSAFAGIYPDAGPLAGLSLAPGLVTLLVTIPALVVVIAVAVRLSGSRAASLILLGAAGAGSLVLFKHLVRPQSQLVLYLPLVGLAWTIVLTWSRRVLAGALAAGLFAGALLAVVQTVGAAKPATFALDALQVPATAVADARLLADGTKLDAVRAARFAPGRFALMPEAQTIVPQVSPYLHASRFATLGDVQILYPLLGQRPPFQIALYNAAPRAQQEQLVRILDREAPPRLVYRRDLNIDNVIYPVRTPIVFAWAIQHYVPEHQGPDGTAWDVLERRAPGQAIPLDYWKSRLAAAVDLGGIPSYSRGAQRPRCSSGPDCVPYAIVTGAPTGSIARIEVEVSAPGGPFSVSFLPRPGVKRYAVRLDRLWFWPLVAGSAQLSSGTPGYAVQTVKVRSDDLY